MGVGGIGGPSRAGGIEDDAAAPAAAQAAPPEEAAEMPAVPGPEEGDMAAAHIHDVAANLLAPVFGQPVKTDPAQILAIRGAIDDSLKIMTKGLEDAGLGGAAVQMEQARVNLFDALTKAAGGKAISGAPPGYRGLKDAKPGRPAEKLPQNVQDLAKDRDPTWGDIGDKRVVRGDDGKRYVISVEKHPKWREKKMDEFEPGVSVYVQEP